MIEIGPNLSGTIVGIAICIGFAGVVWAINRR